MELTCKRGFGKLIYDDINKYYLDQLSDEDDIWKASNWFSTYIQNTYNISAQEYYNIVVYGDINYVHYCPICGTPTTFNRFNRGYNQTCSRSCSNLYLINTKPEYYKRLCNNMSKGIDTQWNSEFRGYYSKLHSDSMKYENKRRVDEGIHNFLTENGGAELASIRQSKLVEAGIHPFQLIAGTEEDSKRKSELQSKLILEGKHAFQTFDARINSEWAVFHNHEGNAYLYVAEFNPKYEDYIKFGITRYPNFREYINYYPLSNLKVLFKGSCQDLSDLEWYMKDKFCRENYYKLNKNHTEAYNRNQFDEILQFINDYLNKESSTTIEKIE